MLLLAAWLLATGSPWDVLQLFAWSRMLVDNVTVMPLPAAIERTFSPAGMCDICQVVQAARQEARADAPAGAFVTKAPLVFQHQDVVTMAPPRGEWLPALEPGMASVGRAAPPAPPPRSTSHAS